MTRRTQAKKTTTRKQYSKEFEDEALGRVQAPTPAHCAAYGILAYPHTGHRGYVPRVYLSAQRDGLNFHLVHIPDDLERQPREQFDPVYMRELFELGRSLGRSDDPWKRAPPGF